MRYDVHTLAELKAAVSECDSGDRIVLFFPDYPNLRFRVRDDSLHREWSDQNGNTRQEEP